MNAPRTDRYKVDTEELKSACVDAQAGNEDAYDRLLPLLRPIILGACSAAIRKAPPGVRRVVTHEVREDIYADVIAEVFTRILPNYRADRNPSSFFYVCALRMAENSLARTTRQENYRVLPAQDAPPGGFKNSFEDVLHAKGSIGSTYSKDNTHIKFDWVTICNVVGASGSKEVAQHLCDNVDLVWKYLAATNASTRTRILNSVSEEFDGLYTPSDVERTLVSIMAEVRNISEDKTFNLSAVGLEEVVQAIDRFYPELSVLVERIGTDKLLTVLVGLAGCRVTFPTMESLSGAVRMMRFEDHLTVDVGGVIDDG